MEIIDAGKARICVSATRVSGRDYVDVRTHVTNHSGVLSPTQHGILIPLEKLEEVLAAAHREHKIALAKEPPPLFYFQETVVDKRAPRQSHSSRVYPSAQSAVERTPEEYGAESNHGYIFKCSQYTLNNLTYTFEPTKPFAVWNPAKGKWVRWEPKVKSSASGKKHMRPLKSVCVKV